jgi:hypothetical protein
MGHPLPDYRDSHPAWLYCQAASRAIKAAKSTMFD